MSEMLTFGVDSQPTLTDQEVVTFAVMVNLECKLDDREVAVARPAYEYGCLREQYSHRGGVINVMANWLVHPKTKQDVHPRVVPLSRDALRAEFDRCNKTFKMMSAAGEKSYFEKCFGRGETSRFVKVVHDQAKMWKNLMVKMKAEGRQPTVEELQTICELSCPIREAEFDLDRITFDKDLMIPGVPKIEEDLGQDEGMMLLDYLVGKGFTPEQSGEVAKLHNEGGVNAKALGGGSEFHGKADLMRKAITEYEAWVVGREP